MTDNEIKKALECCNQNSCQNCPYGKYNTQGWCCMPKVRKDALDLINRLQAENERLKGEMANISAKTLKRFEKNIKDVQVTLGQTWEIQNALKKTYKEMVGEDNG